MREKSRRVVRVLSLDSLQIPEQQQLSYGYLTSIENNED